MGICFQINSFAQRAYPRKTERDKDRERKQTPQVPVQMCFFIYLPPRDPNKDRFFFFFSGAIPRPTGRMCREDGPSRSRHRHEPAPLLRSPASPLSQCPSWRHAQHPLQRGRVCNWGRGISSSVSLHDWKFSQLLLWFLSLTSSFSHFTIRHTPCWAGALLWPSSSLSSPLFPVEVQVLNLLGLLCCSLQQVPLF